MQLLQRILGYIFSATQLSQSAYTPLQLPYAVFGLGQTPNFVDKIEAGIPNPPGTVSAAKFVKLNLNQRCKVYFLQKEMYESIQFETACLFSRSQINCFKMISLIFFRVYVKSLGLPLFQILSWLLSHIPMMIQAGT